MDIKKLDLETLEYVKRICDFQSDMSSRTLGYKWLERTIEELSASQNTSTSDEALHIGSVVGRSEQLVCNSPVNKCPSYMEDINGEKGCKGCEYYY
jgi:hypothetical protein